MSREKSFGELLLESLKDDDKVEIIKIKMPEWLFNFGDDNNFDLWTTYDPLIGPGWSHPVEVSYKPKNESLDDITKYTKPGGKDVLSVAAYGYPLLFLAEGANKILSFDVHPGQVEWNEFLKNLVLSVNHEKCLEPIIEEPFFGRFSDNNLIFPKYVLIFPHFF